MTQVPKTPLYVITRSYGQYRIAMYHKETYRDILDLKQPFNSLKNAQTILAALRYYDSKLILVEPKELKP